MKQKMYLRCQAYNLESLVNFCEKLKKISSTDNISFSSIKLPVQKKRFTILRSPHVNKKAKDQFELKLHNNLIILKSNFFPLAALSKLQKSFQANVVVKIRLCFS